MSSYSHSHPLPMGKNKKVIGLIKDEQGGRIMTEFMALRLKLYTYKTLGGRRDNKCKGVMVHDRDERSILNVQLGSHDEVDVSLELSSHFHFFLDLQSDSSSSTSYPPTHPM